MFALHYKPIKALDRAQGCTQARLSVVPSNSNRCTSSGGLTMNKRSDDTNSGSQRVRHLLIVAVAITAGVFGGLISRVLARQQPESGTIRAREIVVSDGGLVVRSAQGKLIAKLAADENGGFLLVYGNKEQPVASVGGL